MMKRFGQIIRLKPSGAEKYVLLHADTWPGVLAKIKECNISNYSIFMKDNILFAYFEYTGFDYEKDMAIMADHAETQLWWNTVKPLMEPIENRKIDEFWADMDEIFHID
jgi:L-rhamnose mutarotase